MTIDRLRVANLLSFGPTPTTVELRALNVVIGPNGSGKSNLVDILGLLRAMPADLAEPFRGGGGQFRDWLWSGPHAGPTMSLTTSLPGGVDGPAIHHEIELAEHGIRPIVVTERITGGGTDGAGHPSYQRRAGRSEVLRPGGPATHLRDVQDAHSVLSSYDRVSAVPGAHRLRAAYAGIHIFRGFDWGREAKARISQRGDLPSDVLLPSAENLAAVLSELQIQGEAFERLNEHLKRLIPDFRELVLVNRGPQILVFLKLNRLSAPVPLSRLSDGTLRYLSLLVILLNPRTAGLVCLEEPETGLHPDLIADVARLLQDTSQRIQLVVTTHSDHLVDALSDDPGAVLVADRGPDGTNLRRLDAQQLSTWLDEYRLGELWMSGHLGGTRW